MLVQYLSLAAVLVVDSSCIFSLRYYRFNSFIPCKSSPLSIFTPSLHAGTTLICTTQFKFEFYGVVLSIYISVSKSRWGTSHSSRSNPPGTSIPTPLVLTPSGVDTSRFKVPLPPICPDQFPRILEYYGFFLKSNLYFHSRRGNPPGTLISIPCGVNPSVLHTSPFNSPHPQFTLIIPQVPRWTTNFYLFVTYLSLVLSLSSQTGSTSLLPQSCMCQQCQRWSSLVWAFFEMMSSHTFPLKAIKGIQGYSNESNEYSLHWEFDQTLHIGCLSRRNLNFDAKKPEVLILL